MAQTRRAFIEQGAIAAFLESHRDELAGSKPFFYTQHFHPKGTCSAPWAWGEDKGYSTAALSAFPNAVSFTGHSHTPITDDRTLWRGAFTSVKGLAGGAHAFDFQVTVEAEDADRSKIWATKRVYSPHFYWAPERDDDTVSCVFACSELPPPNKVPTVRGRRFRFAVSPANSFGGHGKAIRSDWLTGDFGVTEN